MSSAETKQALLHTAFTMVRDHGVGAVTARALAREAGVNQALVYYHFGSLDDLLVEACAEATEALVARYAPALDEVTSLGQLLSVADRISADGRESGDVRLLAQVVAAAHLDERYTGILARCLPTWYDAVDRAAERVLVAQGLDRALAATDVARLASVAMVGMLLLDGRDGRSADLSMQASRRLGGRLERLLRRVPVAVRQRVLR